MSPTPDSDVFLRGSGLPQRWRERERFVILQTSFGCGHAFLKTWDAWRKDPQCCQRLYFIALEQRLPAREGLVQAHEASATPSLVQLLLRAWPPRTPNIHCMSFEDGRVQLLLASGGPGHPVKEILAAVDAFYLDATDFDAGREESSLHYMAKSIARLAARNASLVSLSTSPALRRGLNSAGFEVRAGAEQSTHATYAPRFKPKRGPVRLATAVGDERHALIVGAGLAGCAAAWALAEQGWRSTVFDRLPDVAQATSGNPAGLFHGVVNPQDGAHARFNRAAALLTEQAVRIALEQHDVAGQLAGALCLEDRYTVEEMQRQLARLGLSSEYVQALNADAASEVCGLPVKGPAWYYRGGGWVRPGGVAESFLRGAGSMTRVQLCAEVVRLRSVGDQWQVLDEKDRVLAQAGVVVLANALDVPRLLGESAGYMWAVRGQTTLLPSTTPGLHLPRIPVTGAGYVLPSLPNGDALCGATSQRDDMDATPRVQDHEQNLAQLARLTGSAPTVSSAALKGRVGWRCVAEDRLPVIGGVPDLQAMQTPGLRLDQARFVPRKPGLFVFTALGSRGITWAALSAQTLASIISGSPCPLEASLLDAVDVARFNVRAARRR